ncbi:MAG: hypothetical protein AAB459_04460 [Patescibacteria group bacterium]
MKINMVFNYQKILIIILLIFFSSLVINEWRRSQNSPQKFYQSNQNKIKSKSQNAIERSNMAFTQILTNSDFIKLSPLNISGTQNKCTADEQWSHHNIFSDPFAISKKLSKSMYCDFVKTHYYVWKGTTKELGYLIEKNVKNLQKGQSFPEDNKYLKAGVIETVIGINPHIYFAFGGKSDSFLYKTELNFSYGKRETATFNLSENTLPFYNEISKLSDSDIIVQILTHEVYFTLYE